MSSPSTIAIDEAEVVRVLHDYYSTFSTLNADAASRYFHEPSLFIGPQGIFAASTHVLVAAALGPFMEALRARGFGRTELRVRNLKLLSATATLVEGVAQRYKFDGQELDRAGVTYVLHKTDSGWKIAVVVTHDPGEAR
jgi:hypothetical protein